MWPKVQGCGMLLVGVLEVPRTLQHTPLNEPLHTRLLQSKRTMHCHSATCYNSFLGGSQETVSFEPLALSPQ